RKADGEFDALARGRSAHVALVLFRREHLRKQVFELHLAPCSSSRHVAQNALEIADSGGEVLHFAESFMNLLEALAHEAERLTEAGLKRGLELLIDRLPHLFEALIGDTADQFQLLNHGGPEGIGTRGQLLAKP